MAEIVFHHSESIAPNYLVISNISKKNNVQALIHTAQAYNFVPIVVGMKAIMRELDPHLNMAGSYKYMETMKDLSEFLTTEGIPLIAIEITESATNVLHFPFSTSSTAFMPGNEGSGLNITQRNAANGFIYIPQYGSGTASLNVTVATSIILHQYHRWFQSTCQ